MYWNKTVRITGKGQVFSVSSRKASLANPELRPASSDVQMKPRKCMKYSGR